MDHAAGLPGVLLGSSGGGGFSRCQRIALLLIQQGDHPLGQVVGLGDVPGRQAGVRAGDEETDVLLLQRFQPPGGVPPADVAQHEHGVQAAGDGQIQNLQRAVLAVLVLIFRLRQGHPLLLHVRPAADEHPVVAAPGRKAEAAVDLQILDGVEDIGAVLHDLAEQAPQGLAALVEDTGRVEDGAVDAAALEDADVLQRHAVGRKEVVGVHLHGVHAAQLLNGGPAGHHSPCRCRRALQPQGGQPRHQRGGEGRAHAEHRRQGCSAAADPAAKQQEDNARQHRHAQQDERGLVGAALTGPLAKALLHQRFVPLGGAAEQDPGVLLVQTAGEQPDEVLIPDAVGAAVLRLAHGQVVPALDGGQLHPAAQQGQKQAQRGDAGQEGKAGLLVVRGVEQGHNGLQQRSAGSQRGHGVGTGAVPQALQAVPQDRVGHGQRARQKQQVGRVERRRGDDGVQHPDGGQHPLGHQAEVEQHQRQHTAEGALQCKGRAHAAQLFAHRLRGGGLFRLFGRGRLRRRLGGLGLRGFRLFRRRGLGRAGRSRHGRLAVVLGPKQRDAHAVVGAGGRLPGGSRHLIIGLAEEAEGGRLCRLFVLHPRLGRRRLGRGGLLRRGRRHGLGRGRVRLGQRCFFFCKDKARQRSGRLFFHRLGRGGRFRRSGGGSGSGFGRRLRLAEEHGLQLLHLLVLLLLHGRAGAGGRRPCGPVFRLFLRLFLRGRSGLGGRGLRGGSGCRRLCRFFRGEGGIQLLVLKGQQLLIGVAGQLQPGVRLLHAAVQPDLPRRRQSVRLFRFGLCGRFGGVLPAAEQPPEQPFPGRFFRSVLAVAHGLGHLRHAGAEKGPKLLGVQFFLRQFFLALVLIWHPCPSLIVLGYACSGVFGGTLGLDLVQDDACGHRDVEAVHAGALGGHVQGHHAVAELFHQLGDAAALAAHHQRDGAGEVVFAQGHAVHIGAVDKDALLLQAADGLADVGHPGHGQALGGTGAGLDDGGRNGSAAPLGDDDAVGAAQQRRAHHRAQIVGVLDAVAQHEEGRLALLFGDVQQLLHRDVGDLAGKGGHALMALGAGHEPQLVGVHPLDGGPHLLGHGGVVSRYRRGHALGNEHGVHAGAALEQLGDGVFAVHEALVLLLGLLRAAAGAARGVFLFHGVFSSHFYGKTPKASKQFSILTVFAITSS